MMQTAKQHSSFQALVAANRSAGRLDCPVAPDNSKRMKLAGMRLLPDELAKAQELASSDERSVASFLRRVYLRGLEGYLADLGKPTSAQ